MGGHSEASEPTRERVRATIGLVGSYWRPLAAVARLLEELSELAELDRDHSGYASELADLWIITTALSDQFLGAVAEPGSHLPHRQPSDLLGSLVTAAGRIARIVNYYDGPKTPRTFDGWMSLGEAVADFHRALDQAAYTCGVDLAKAVDTKLDAIPAIDTGRFSAYGHDPSIAASLELFRTTVISGAGFDVGRARMWGAPEWSSNSELSIQAIVADLTSFTKAAAWERLDAYVICFPAQFSSVTVLDEWLKHLLLEIAAHDPTGGDRPTAAGPVDAAERRFTFNGVSLLVSVISSFHDAVRPQDPLPDADDWTAVTRRLRMDAHHSFVGTFALLRVEHAADDHAAQ